MNREAAPIPDPMHIEVTKVFPPLRRSSCNPVATCRAPVQPSGCPNAIAPPLTLTFEKESVLNQKKKKEKRANLFMRKGEDINHVAKHGSESLVNFKEINFLLGKSNLF